jgi:hypothetical protein
MILLSEGFAAVALRVFKLEPQKPQEKPQQPQPTGFS